ncbi:unnamed protein product [Rhizophagus irregularis]|nr:unnamed protein product [Rhizophagus irregularis]
MRFAGANHTIRTLHPTTDIQISNRYQRCWQNINSSKTGVKISVIGMVCSSIADKQENIKVLNQAIDLGCTFWDSADIYDNGANEILFSKVLKDHHNELFLCTKFGIIRGPNGEFSVSDPNTTIEDTIGALAELVKEGKIKYISLSECSADTFQQAYKVHPIAAIQKGVTPGQLCLSWILAQGDNMIVIPGTRKIKHFEGNVEAVKVKLSSEELAEIRQIINSIEIIGNRYNDFL